MCGVRGEGWGAPAEGGGEEVSPLWRFLQHAVLDGQHAPTRPHLLPQLGPVLLRHTDLQGGGGGGQDYHVRLTQTCTSRPVLDSGFYAG